MHVMFVEALGSIMVIHRQSLHDMDVLEGHH